MPENLQGQETTEGLNESLRNSRALLQKRAYTIKDAVHVSSLGRTTIYSLIGSGLLKTVKVGGRRLISAESLHHLLEAGDVGGADV